MRFGLIRLNTLRVTFAAVALIGLSKLAHAGLLLVPGERVVTAQLVELPLQLDGCEGAPCNLMDLVCDPRQARPVLLRLNGIEHGRLMFFSAMRHLASTVIFPSVGTIDEAYVFDLVSAARIGAYEDGSWQFVWDMSPERDERFLKLIGSGERIFIALPPFAVPPRMIEIDRSNGRLAEFVESCTIAR